ncbi:MAG TPA: polyprenyl diphosphate synthase [Terriglobia bacterium]|nr:polyprenyl diphosphate synthase [Terriglobia bacterium]
MIQSTLLQPSRFRAGTGLHLAIIMDGSGRWAERRGWPRATGHRAGERAVRRTVEAAVDAGIGTLTLFAFFAFSGANWRRPLAEAARLMEIFRGFFESQAAAYGDQGVRVNVIGRRDRLPAPLLAAIKRAEQATAAGSKLHLRLAIDYSAREAVLEAALRLASSTNPARQAFAQALAEAIHESAPAPDIDLLIRTGGEQRLSDCLLWEGAFAEIVFSDCLWPDFGKAELAAALAEFHQRERRFGGVSEAIAG